MHENAAFYQPELGNGKIVFSMCVSSIKIHYSVSIINEVYVM